MEKLGIRSYKHSTSVNCFIGEDHFPIGNIDLVLVYRIPKAPPPGGGESVFQLSHRSKNKLYNKISGHYGVKVNHITMHYSPYRNEEGVLFAIPRTCTIITNLKAERRNRLKVILSD